jgi:hypothetical protein
MEMCQPQLQDRITSYKLTMASDGGVTF